MPDAYELCSTLLTSVVTRMEALGSTLPSVQYVAPGVTVAYDGEQVTTNVTQLFAGHPGAQDPYVMAPFQVLTVELMVCIVRYTPGLEDGPDGGEVIPSPKVIQANAQLALEDVTNLSLALMGVITDKDLGTAGMPVGLGPVRTVGPEGGVVAVTGTLTMPFV